MENAPTSSVVETVSTMQSGATSNMGLPLKQGVLMRKTILLLIVGVFTLVAAGVGVFLWQNRQRQVNVAPTTRPITLIYWSMIEDSEAFRAIRTQFQADNPGVTIQYSYQSPKDYSERVIAACARNQCPDVFRFHSTWASQYSNKALIATIPTSVLTNAEFESTYYPVITTDLRSATGYLGIPLMYDGLGLYVNTRILQASGKSVPTTWDELRTLARELTIRNASGGIDRSGIALGTSNNVDHFSDIVATLIFQNGGDPLAPEGFGSASQVASGTGSTPASLVGDALTFYTQFVRADKIWDETMPNSTYAFAIERTAMIIAPAYRAAEIKKINPNFDFSVHPIPQLPGTPVTNANYWVEGVAQSSKESEMAWKFLKYLSSRPVLEKLNPTGDGKLLKEVYPRMDMAELLANDPYAHAIVTQASHARSSHLASRTFDKGVNDGLINLYSEVISKMGSGTRYEELAVKFSPQVIQLVQSYGLTKRTN